LIGGRGEGAAERIGITEGVENGGAAPALGLQECEGVPAGRVGGRDEDSQPGAGGQIDRQDAWGEEIFLPIETALALAVVLEAVPPIG
jgi:hypothetical protein